MTKVNIKYLYPMGNILFLSLLMIAIPFASRGYDLDEFDDLELQALDSQKKKMTKRNDVSQRLILFDDNLYLLDDEFDFHNDKRNCGKKYFELFLSTAQITEML